ncbi:hypothetical protein L1049_022698 [Liquidambar formosana]|uniref:RNase H type-1 domain-containing protein n=1 Tax=Liquidambar formosana TaxID=63359 RepID=A0AAP0RCX9_LIQFO
MPVSMIILAWNCRGLAQASTVRQVKAVVQVQWPNCIFLSKTKDCDWTSCLIEGDALKVVNAILKPHNCPWEFEVIIGDIVEDLRCLPKVGFDYVPKRVNSVAHAMARWSLITSLSGFFPTQSLPFSILEACLLDGCNWG